MGATGKTMSDKTNSTQLAVIGGGPGGYAAAFLAADLGMKVTLIDPEPNPGGVCLYRGCIPSKALLHAARVLTEAREAANWGIEFPALSEAEKRASQTVLECSNCHARESADRVSVAAVAGEGQPWTLTFLRAGARWRLADASPMLQ